MANKKYKVTGCARLFFVLLILIPLAYFGAKMINDGEGVPQIDNFIENIFTKADDQDAASPNSSSSNRNIDVEKQNTLIRDLQNQLDDLKEENEMLKKELQRLKQE